MKANNNDLDCKTLLSLMNSYKGNASNMMKDVVIPAGAYDERLTKALTESGMLDFCGFVGSTLYCFLLFDKWNFLKIGSFPEEADLDRIISEVKKIVGDRPMFGVDEIDGIWADAVKAAKNQNTKIA